MKNREFEIIVNKLQLETRDTGDRHAFLIHDGKQVIKTKISHGRCELPDHWFRKQLHVNERQLAELVGCTLSRVGYLAILRGQGRL